MESIKFPNRQAVKLREPDVRKKSQEVLAKRFQEEQRQIILSKNDHYSCHILYEGLNHSAVLKRQRDGGIKIETSKNFPEVTHIVINEEKKLRQDNVRVVSTNKNTKALLVGVPLLCGGMQSLFDQMGKKTRDNPNMVYTIGQEGKTIYYREERVDNKCGKNQITYEEDKNELHLRYEENTKRMIKSHNDEVEELRKVIETLSKENRKRKLECLKYAENINEIKSFLEKVASGTSFELDALKPVMGGLSELTKGLIRSLPVIGNIFSMIETPYQVGKAIVETSQVIKIKSEAKSLLNNMRNIEQ